MCFYHEAQKEKSGLLLRRQFRVILLCLGPLVVHQPGSSSPLLKVFRSQDCISLATVRWTVFDVEMALVNHHSVGPIAVRYSFPVFHL